MYHIKNDQRAIRSSQMLYDGLASLMRESAFSTITVTDLVKTSQVGRATFYRNFDDIEDVLRLRCDQVFDEFAAYYFEYTQQHGFPSRFPRLKLLLRYFYHRSEIIELLMMANRLEFVAASFRRVLEPLKTQSAARYGVLEEDYRDFGLTIRIGVAISILVRWIETGKQQAPDDLADRLGAMLESMMMHDRFL